MDRARALSPREAQVLRLIRDGRQDKEIAVALHLSESTVGHYVRGIFLKLGAKTRAHAVALHDDGRKG